MSEEMTMPEGMSEAAEGAEGSEAATEHATPDVPEWQKIKHKVKVDQEELEVDYDEMVRGYQRSSAANKRFAEAAQMRREAEAFLSKVKTDPFEAMKQLGVSEHLQNNPKALKALREMLPREVLLQFSEENVWEEIQESKLTPEQKRLKELEAWKAAEDARKAEEEAEREKSAREQEIDGIRAQFEKTIVDTLETSGLPKTAETVKRMSSYWLSALDQGYDPDPRDIVEMVQESYQSEIKSVVGGLSVEQIAALFGDDVLKKIREHDLQRVKGYGSQTKDPARGHSAVGSGRKSRSLEEALNRIHESTGFKP